MRGPNVIRDVPPPPTDEQERRVVEMMEKRFGEYLNADERRAVTAIMPLQCLANVPSVATILTAINAEFVGVPRPAMSPAIAEAFIAHETIRRDVSRHNPNRFGTRLNLTMPAGAK